MMKENTIYFEDCLEGMKKIPDASIDAIICDLPYGTTACSWDSVLPWEELWAAYLRVTKKNSPIVLFGAEPFSTALRSSNLSQYKYDWYWLKNNVTGFTFAKTQPMRCVETISVFSKGTPNYYPQGLVALKQPKTAIRKETKENIYAHDGNLSGKEYTQTMTGYPNHVFIRKRIYTNDDWLPESCIEVSERNKAYVPPHAKTCRFTGIFGENLYKTRRTGSR
uniref:DNA methylase n=1 Tax=Enterococcus faecalis TaxID=1351 RepID=UPI001F2B88BF|nr:DNA methylase [Enterococcus faecalis]